ncbi:hypothetical protein [Herbaspirillum seropedicae]|uniref:hypothetical protein n=1 Tax=Herbaspirillum seropedicae TaxID=964 RepID=UPI002862F818|nr:hypothetical protein [Herbaspirillum seropedicae]MDR6396908.1 hypothetical protein [Herbaspirillum seropedicae]
MTQADINEQIRAALFQLREVYPRSYIHLLLDGNHPCEEDDPLHFRRLPAREIPAKPVTVTRADFSHEPAICPALVTLYAPGDRGYPDEALLDLSIAHAWRRRASVNGSYVCGWLVSESPAEILAPHIASACELFDLQLGRKRVLPLFEPHRLALVAEAGKDVFLRRWLGPVSHWLWLDLNGSLRSLVAHDLDVTSTTGKEHLGLREWKMQQRVADASLIAMAMIEAQNPLPARPEIAFDAALQRAQDMGLRRTEDLVFAALNDFSFSAQWVQHPASQRAIRQALEGEKTLSELMCELPDAILEEIAAQGPGDVGAR